jgi:hypothetical protein
MFRSELGVEVDKVLYGARHAHFQRLDRQCLHPTRRPDRLKDKPKPKPAILLRVLLPPICRNSNQKHYQCPGLHSEEGSEFA